MISTKEDSNELVDRGGARERVTWLEHSVDTKGSVSFAIIHEESLRDLWRTRSRTTLFTS